MSVFKRSSDGRWIARVRTSDGVRHFTGTNRDEVIARAAEFDPYLKVAYSIGEERRFWGKVFRGTGCWLWCDSLDETGRGKFRAEGRLVFAYRFAYEVSIGPTPTGYQIDHLCHNPWCVRPSHLEPVTASENHRRRRSQRWDLI